jgi:hypothetical protein
MMQCNLISRVKQPVAAIMLALALTLPLGALAQDNMPSSATLYPPVEMGTASQQVPAGMQLKIQFITPLDSKTSNLGDAFVALSAADLWAGDQLVLPQGSTVRGRVAEVQRPGFFSKGGLLRLTFDHVVMPSGELKPLSLEVDTASAKMSRSKNALYTDPGISSKLNTSVDNGVSQFKSFYDKGIKAGQNRGGGMNMLLTVPTNTLAGVATGTAITTVGAAKAVFGKGESVTLQPGDVLTIDFSKAATLPGH